MVVDSIVYNFCGYQLSNSISRLYQVLICNFGRFTISAQPEVKISDGGYKAGGRTNFSEVIISYK